MPVHFRLATPDDAAAITALLTQLGYPAAASEMAARLDRMTALGPPDRVVVAVMEEQVVGVMTLHLTPELHRAKPIGRVTALVVDEQVRGSGIGAAMMAEAERILRADGAGLLEVTSNMRRTDAHRFYERLGYLRTSYRFAKEL
ncbi:MAG TPA: GNAT family N-acetyltransferase [Gemmatimonadales bacterium]|nr:GNAT family N-acetyltransferase [Gemmatimonadales bacterium]